MVPVEEDDVSETAEVPETKNDLSIPDGNYYKNTNVSELKQFCGDKKKHLKDFKNRALRLSYDDISSKSNDLLVLDVNKLFDIINKKTKNPFYKLTKEEFEYVNKINNRLEFKTDKSILLGEQNINEIKSIVEQKKKDLSEGKYNDVKSWISGYSTQHQKNAGAYIRSFFTPKLGGNKRSRKSKQSRKYIRKLRKSNK